MKHFLLSLLTLWTLSTFAQAATVKQVTYPVYGQTAWQLRTQLQQRGAHMTNGGGWAQTQISQNYKAGWEMRYGRCFITHFKLTMQLTQILPHWPNKSSAPLCLQKSWDTMLTSLKAHENKHLQAYLTMEKQINVAIKALSSQPNCMMMQSALENTWKGITNQMARWHSDFDRQTRNGQLEGVALLPCR